MGDVTLAAIPDYYIATLYHPIQFNAIHITVMSH